MFAKNLWLQVLQEFKNIISIANDLNIPQILNNSQLFYSHQSCQGPALAGRPLIIRWEPLRISPACHNSWKATQTIFCELKKITYEAMVLLLIGWTRLTQSPAWGKLRKHPHQRSRTCDHHRPPFLRLLSQECESATLPHHHQISHTSCNHVGVVVFWVSRLHFASGANKYIKRIEMFFCQQNVRYKTDSRPWLHCLMSDCWQTWNASLICFPRLISQNMVEAGQSQSFLNPAQFWWFVMALEIWRCNLQQVTRPTTSNNPFNPPVL